MIKYKLIDDSDEQLSSEYVQNANVSIYSICERHKTIFKELSNCKGQLCDLNALSLNTPINFTNKDKKHITKSLQIIDSLLSQFKVVSQNLVNLQILICQLTGSVVVTTASSSNLSTTTNYDT